MKHLFKNTLGFFILLLASTCQVFGQEIIFNKVTPPDGNSFHSVKCITQDMNGYMWFATINGLCRYDGYQIITYNHNPLDSNSLASDTLNSIAIDLTGKIWIGTWTGLDQFDPNTGKFKHYHHNSNDTGSLSSDSVLYVFIDHEGILWAAGNGLDRYDKQSDSFIHYRNIPGDSTSLSCNEVNTIYEDRRGTIWVGTGSFWDENEENKDKGGLNRMNKETGTFTPYKHDSNKPNSLISNKVSAIFEDSKGTFWVGTTGDGLHTMDREKGTFIRHTYDPAHPEKLCRPPLVNLSKEFQRFERITFINEDATGTMWIGTFNEGMICYNPTTGKINNFESNKGFESEYILKMPSCFYTSKEGMIWIGTEIDNLYRIDPFMIQIPHHTKSNVDFIPLYKDPKGIIWSANEEGLVRIDKVNGFVKRDVIDVNPSISNPNYIFVIKPDRQGNVLIGTSEGLALWDKKTELFNLYIIQGGPIGSIFEDRDSNLWIGNDNGLCFFNRKTGLSTQYFIYPKEDVINTAKNSVSSILQDKTGKLWVGTWYGGGINLFNRETGKFKTYLNGKSFSTIYEDADGILWASGWNGLYKFERGVDDFIRFTGTIKSSEIIRIKSIIEDNDKYLWLCTIDGIVRINPQRNGIKIYGKEYGIDVNQLGWNSAYKGQNGELYFGDETGYISFDPKEFTRNITPPQIVFTRLFLGDQSIEPDKAGPLKESLSQAKVIQLSYNQNVFTFEFAAIDYSNSEENQHFCMLENYDTDWRKLNSERRAYYFNVPPGKYVFHVKAMSSNGEWAEKKIDVIILPPWWRTWWAYVIYGLLLIALVFGIDRFQRRRLLKAEKERNRERELAQAKEIEKAYLELGKAHETLKSTQSQLIQSEKMASLGELTAGIAHEIQNPLNFVNNFSEVSNELIDEMNEELDKGDIDEAKAIASDIKQNLEKINHHGKRAGDIVKGMLQHSRTSSGVKEPTDINALADEYLRLAYHGLRAKDKSFNAEFKTDFDPSLPKINVIPQDIGRVLLNLINNAFYAVSSKASATEYSGYKPEVIVTTKNHSDKIEISVKDNGDGIPAHIVDKIFQPFFTTKPTGQGTGLGLSLSYDIVKAHGGELKVETKEGEGTEFIIIIPVTKIENNV